MSKRMADSFFPACLDHINRHRVLAFLYHHVVFPESVAQECPEYVVTYEYSSTQNSNNMHFSWSIRQPFLLLAALWGVWIGTTGFLRLRSNATTETNMSWAVALLTFGIMNFSAVFIHCLWPAPMKDYPTDYPFFWAIDTYMTGVSASCLVIASLEELQSRWTNRSSIRNDGDRNHDCQLLELVRALHLQRIAATIQLIGVLCIFWFVTSPAPHMAAASHPLELWYILPVIIAALPVLLVLYENWWIKWYKTIPFPWQKGDESMLSSSDPTRRIESPLLSVGQAVFASSVFVAGILGIAMDRFWCLLVGYSLARDFLSANTFVFLGCDLAFWGLVQCLSESCPKEARVSLYNNNNTKKKSC